MRWLFAGPTGVYLLDLFFFRYSVLFTVESLSLLYPLLYLDLYVLGEDALISQGSFMQTKYLCVLIHILIKSEV